jgi:nicotinamide riboside kinase
MQFFRSVRLFGGFLWLSMTASLSGLTQKIIFMETNWLRNVYFCKQYEEMHVPSYIDVILQHRPEHNI